MQTTIRSNPEIVREDKPAKARTFTIGAIPGEGVGPELIEICTGLLKLLSERFAWTLNIETCGHVGHRARAAGHNDLPEHAIAFADHVFNSGGVILAGAGGGRFVYEMRRRFDLFVKINPIHPLKCSASGTDKPFDITIVRDNREGIYQGNAVVTGHGHSRKATHSFESTYSAVSEITELAAKLAATRSGHMTVVAKESGIQDVSRMWSEAGRESSEKHGVKLQLMDIDFAVYQMVRHPEKFDVIATGNCFGDILADLGGLLMGSRGNTYGASYNHAKHAVYQTNHGAAFDLAGKNTANPAGQILSTAMLLRESFQLDEEATLLEQALENTWAAGHRTADLQKPDQIAEGTGEFVEAVRTQLCRLMET